jgi:hypothetical protein
VVTGDNKSSVYQEFATLPQLIGEGVELSQPSLLSLQRNFIGEAPLAAPGVDLSGEAPDGTGANVDLCRNAVDAPGAVVERFAPALLPTHCDLQGRVPHFRLLQRYPVWTSGGRHDLLAVDQAIRRQSPPADTC